MLCRKTAAIAAGAIFWSSLAFAQSPVLESEAGQWQKVSASGLVIYQTSQQTGSGASELLVDCDEAHTLDYSWTGLSLTLNGNTVPPQSNVTFTVGEDSVAFSTDKAGGVSLDNADSIRDFRKLWSLLREGERVRVAAANGNSATLSLAGTRKLMPAEPCQTP